MRAFGIVNAVSALMSLALTLGSEAPARAEDLPDHFKTIVSVEKASPSEVGAKNILQLDTSMFELYGDAGQILKKNILAEHPIILGLFSGAGGRFVLYRHGMAPLEAPSVPVAYQLLKSVGHSTMALGEIVMPYLDNASHTS